MHGDAQRWGRDEGKSATNILSKIVGYARIKENY